VFALRVDCADARSVREAFEGVLSLGPVEVLVYSACEPPADRPTPFLSVSPDAFHRSLAVSAVGAFHCAQQVLPGMVERGRGTIIFTGSSASVTGFGGYADLSKYRPVSWPPSQTLSTLVFIYCEINFNYDETHAGCGKFAMRGLSQSLVKEFQPAGVHIAHVIIDGVIGERRLVIVSEMTALFTTSSIPVSFRRIADTGTVVSFLMIVHHQDGDFDRSLAGVCDKDAK
jgi:NAD(P)-dependent dehydrogenase (short-subunit alcohol dehydrogenase family)